MKTLEKENVEILIYDKYLTCLIQSPWCDGQPGSCSFPGDCGLVAVVEAALAVLSRARSRPRPRPRLQGPGWKLPRNAQSMFANYSDTWRSGGWVTTPGTPNILAPTTSGAWYNIQRAGGKWSLAAECIYASIRAATKTKLLCKLGSLLWRNLLADTNVENIHQFKVFPRPQIIRYTSWLSYFQYL